MGNKITTPNIIPQNIPMDAFLWAKEVEPIANGRQKIYARGNKRLVQKLSKSPWPNNIKEGVKSKFPIKKPNAKCFPLKSIETKNE